MKKTKVVFHYFLILAIFCSMIGLCTFGISYQSARAATVDVNSEATLRSALSNYNAGDTIKLTSNITFRETDTISSNLVLTSGKALTIDLNGFSLTGTRASDGGYAIEVRGTTTLTFEDNSAAKTGVVRMWRDGAKAATLVLGDTAKLILNNVKVEGSSYVITNHSTNVSSVTIIGGEVIKNSTAAGNAIYNGKTGGILISEGAKVRVTESADPAIYNADTGRIVVSSANTEITSKCPKATAGGTITLTKVATSAMDFAVLDVQNGTVSNTASPEGYSVYYTEASGVTSDNLSKYYRHSAGTVGDVFPSAPKTKITVVETAQTAVYSGTGKAFSVSSTPSLSGFTVEYFVGAAWTTTAPTDAGAYDIKIKRAEDETYAAVDVTVTQGLTIGKAQPTITWSSDSKTATTDFGSIVYSYAASETGEYGATLPTEPGTYWIKATIAGTSNFDGAEQIRSFTISDEPVSNEITKPVPLTWLWVLLGILLFLIGIYLAAFFFLYKKNKLKAKIWRIIFTPAILIFKDREEEDNSENTDENQQK